MYEREPDGLWPETAHLVASEASVNDLFGASVSLDGDGALVGAPFDALVMSGVPSIVSGSAYFFERNSNGIWVEVVRLLPSDGADSDNFGTALCLQGDRALVGAHLDDDNGSSSGSVYAFERDTGGAWSETAKLLASDGALADVFGSALSLSGDRALIGAYQDDDNGSNSGSAYLFERQSNGSWLEIQKIVASDGGAGDRFGHSVALEGDCALIGAPNHDDLGSDSGAVYVFERSQGGAWIEVEKLVANGGDEGDVFGWSMSLSADRALISAHLDNTLGTLSGAAYVFRRDGNGDWNQEAKLQASDEAPDDLFGGSVSIAGDRALVGSPQDDAAAANSGSAVLFDLLPLSSTVTELSLSSGGTQPLEIDAGHLRANEPYHVLGSMSGTSPGIPLAGGFVLPLNPDRYLVRTLERPNLPPLANSKGVLNAAGRADAAFSTVPLDVQLAGMTVHHAFVTLGSIAAASTGSSPSPAPRPALATFVSNAFPLLFVP